METMSSIRDEDIVMSSGNRSDTGLQERRVYSKFRRPDLIDIGNMRPGVSRDRILEAWLVTRLSGDQAVYRTSNSQLYFCDPASGETSAVLRQVFLALKVSRRIERVGIDALGAIFVGMKVDIEPVELPVISAALRLSGIAVESLEL